MAGSLLSANEVARRFSVTPLSVYRWSRSGRLRPIRIGRLLRFPLEEVERFLKSEADTRINRDITG
jgi:excisionase family DNA binding protein